MRSALVVVSSLAVATAFGGVAAASWPASFVWQPRAERSRETGERSRREGKVQLERRITRQVSSEEQVEEVNRACEWRYEREVVSARKGKVGRERYTLEKWSCTDDAGFPETTLEGKTITVDDGKRARRARVDGKAIGEVANAWVDREVVPALDPVIEAVLPPGPARSGDEWSVDPVRLAIALDLHRLSAIVPERSKVTGKLSGVRVEEDVHVGAVEVEGTITLESFPGTALKWLEGGVFRTKVTIRGPLEPTTARPVSIAFEGELDGRTEGELPSGERAVQKVRMRVRGEIEDRMLEPRPKATRRAKARRR